MFMMQGTEEQTDYIIHKSPKGDIYLHLDLELWKQPNG